MVSVQSDRGFHRLREYNDCLDDTNLSAQQKAVRRYQKTDYGRQKTYKAFLRYINKPYYCPICNKNILIKSKYLHVRSKNILRIAYTSIRI